jgi:hypothetical protein
MEIISAQNVNDALLLGLQAVNKYGLLRDSRNGPVKVFETPVTTIYERPMERVVFYPERDANPFFHFMEGLWMISGRRDVEWISRFNSSIVQFSDDGKTFHGAYGYRWRKHFGLDQLDLIADLLRTNPDDRRIVLQMWDPLVDLGHEGKDFPCNTAIKFRINDGRLDMTVENRSNDMIWGAYGANAVHFSMLQEFMAAWIGVNVGHYWQISTNFHAYTATMEKHASLLDLPIGMDSYATREVAPFPMVNTHIEQWQRELSMFMENSSVIGFEDKFFKKVAVPIAAAWHLYKKKDHMGAINCLIDNCVASDWQKACIEWIERKGKANV